MTHPRAPLPHAHLLLVTGDPQLASTTRLLLDQFSDTARFTPLRHVEDVLPIVRRNRPDLILLDLTAMSIPAALTYVATLKRDATLCIIPVVVLAPSLQEPDIWAVYREHANAYMHRPEEAEALEDALRCLLELYFRVAILARSDDGRGQSAPSRGPGE